MPPRRMLSRWFALDEFAVSGSHPELVVSVPPALQPVMGRLARHCLDPIRDWLGQRWIISSGYRSEALNRACRGSRTSQHRFGEAADGHAHDAADTRRVFEALLTRRIDIPAGQVIWYPDQHFVHVALPSPRYAALSCHVHWPARHLEYQRVSTLSALRSFVPLPTA